MNALQVLLIILTVSGGGASDSAAEVRLAVRGDDMGAAHAVNVACMQACREGIVKTVEVIVPGPWFQEAARMLAEFPEVDVGVHLTLTSEWDNCKWGPVTPAPSLTGPGGRFLPMTRQRPDFPPGTGFVEAQPDLKEVERELRAQIELARRAIPRISHLSAHMGTAMATQELRDLTLRLADEYHLPLELEIAKPAGGLGGQDASPKEKEATLVKIVNGLRPGLWVLIDHPGLDTPEMQAFGHKGYARVAADRAGVTFAVCSPKVKKAIADRHVRLVSYREALGASAASATRPAAKDTRP